MKGLAPKAAVSTALCLIAAIGGFAPAADPDPIYLGVAVPESGWGGLRVVFRYLNGRWEPMPENPNSLEQVGESFPHMGEGYPPRVSWTVAFDGKKIGALTTTQPAHFTQRGDLGMQVASPRSILPKVRDSAKRFHFYGFRPLVLVSKPNYADPDVWKPFHPTDEALIKRARDAFRGQFGSTARCSARCSDASILVQEGYRSARGDVLIALSAASEKVPGEPEVERLLCNCDGANWDHGPDWYLIRNGAIAFVGSLLTLIDAGDYDGDGVSEILFWKEGEGDAGDGYVLLCPRDASIHAFYIPTAYSF